MSDTIQELVDRADLDGLIRLIDGLCARRAWSDVLRTRDVCREATRTGRQVWPIATLCEYRLALHAPAEWASRVVDDGSSRFSIGPLTEVVAQNHTWSELEDRIPPGPHRELVAHERVLRGETISFADPSDASMRVLDVPLYLCKWEPEYPLAEYSDEGIVATCPSDLWTHVWVDVPEGEHFAEIDDEDTEAALRSLVEPWTAQSAGSARCIVAEGGLGALAPVLGRPALRSAELTTHEALAWLAWCGASGGSHGRRRGAAAGRFNAWWLLAALAGLSHEWDDLHSRGALDAELGRAAQRMTWHRIELGQRHSFELSLAAVDTDEDLMFGLFAHDDPM